MKPHIWRGYEVFEGELFLLDAIDRAADAQLLSRLGGELGEPRAFRRVISQDLHRRDPSACAGAAAASPAVAPHEEEIPAIDCLFRDGRSLPQAKGQAQA